MPMLDHVKKTVHRVKDSVAHHQERHRPSGFQFALFDSVAMLRPDHWDGLTADESVYFSRKYLGVLETNAPANLRMHYALIYRDGRPVAAVVAQAVEVRGDAVPRPDIQKAARTSLSKVKERILVCGNLLSWGFHGVAFGSETKPSEIWPAVAEALYRIRRADKLFGETGLVMIKDLNDEVDANASPLARFNYRPMETEPNMVFHVDPKWNSFEDYLKHLRSGYRNSVKKVMKDFSEGGFTLEPLDEDGVKAHQNEIHGLYHQVHDQQKLRLISLSPDFIPALARTFGEEFHTHIARDPGGKAVGFITTLKDQEGAVGYYIGFDKEAAAKGAPIYLRLLQRTIQDAIEMKAKWLSLGRTALQPKAQLGAQPVPLRCYVRHRIPAMNAVVRGFLNFMPEPDTAPERNPFK
ncbi:MAG: GNAT family N-acetyltransferase [Holophagaceae bacterium]|nr:GNAT family N-acetyltransferase [Holophagaceae bacterium]